MHRALSAIGVVIGLSLVASWLLAADRPAEPTVTTQSEERAVEPGVAVTFEHAESGDRDRRVDRLLALYVPADHQPSALLPAGPFTATWQGNLNVPLRDRYNFRFTGRGTFTLKINDEVILEAEAAGDAVTVTSDGVWLRQGANRVEATYTAPAKGDAQVRFEWSSPDFIFEPPSPTVWTHAVDEELQQSQQVRRGRVLFTQQRCTRCHSAPAEFGGDGAMPELAMDAPAIMDVGLRLKEPWLADWVRDPHGMREDATMPKLFHGEGAGEDARDVAAYLATLEFGALADASPIPREESVAAQGGELFASLGCVGCHTLSKTTYASDDRLSLRHVAAKFEGPALREFLREPSRRYAHIAMPDFDLDAVEATALAAYLLHETREPDDAADYVSGDAQRGQQLVAQAGCINCHALPVASQLDSPALARLTEPTWQSGCLAEDAAERGQAPQLALDEADRSALRDLAEHGWEAVANDNAAEYAQRQLTQLNCNACHQLDGQLDRWSFHEGEIAHLLPPPPESNEPELDQSRPPLTWAGEKLQPDYMRALIAGELENKPRPWMEAVMPAFDTAARAGFAEALAMSHGMSPQVEQPEVDPELADIGRRLVSDRYGFGCTDCHGIGSYPPQNVFDAVGNNFATVADRLRHGYYHRWMSDPPRYVPRTKMPRYADRHGYTALADTLDGDARAQFEAIWHYLMTQPEGNPLSEQP